MSNNERKFSETTTLISVTDLKGDIQYCNRDFVEISGYKEDELIGAHHNIVRHPDMPKAAFNDLWSTIKSDKPWQGMVKNQCKNGDYYWVDAYVTPVYQDNKKIGYQSVRSCPSRKQIEQAEKLYRRLNADRSKSLPKKSFIYTIPLEAQANGLLAIIFLAMLYTLVKADALFNASLMQITINAVLIAAFVGLAFVLNKQIFGRIPALTQTIRRISAGDLTQNIQSSNADTIGEAILSAKMLQGRMKAILGRFNESVHVLHISSDVLSDAAYKTNQSMSQQNTETEMVATAMHEMSATVAEVAQNTVKTSELASGANTVAGNGQTVVEMTRQTILELSDDISGISETVNTLARECQEIKDITQTISAIAGQTNLLALNAAIEAARAGESGRGFAVVADEVRVLALRTQNSTVEIDEMIEKLQMGSNQAVTATEHGLLKVQHCVEKIQKSDEAFALIVSSVADLNDMNTQIATAAEQQSSVAEEMNVNVQSISSLSQKTLNDMSSLENRIESLSEMSQTLKQQLDQYDFGEPTSHFDFSKAKEAHLNWKARVRDLLNGDVNAITSGQLCSHRECDLGRWYYGVGGEKYGHLKHFKDIEAPHARLHQIVASVYEYHVAGDQGQANALYEELEPLSQNIVSLLDKTERAKP